MSLSPGHLFIYLWAVYMCITSVTLGIHVLQSAGSRPNNSNANPVTERANNNSNLNKQKRLTPNTCETGLVTKHLSGTQPSFSASYWYKPKWRCHHNQSTDSNKTFLEIKSASLNKKRESSMTFLTMTRGL